MRNVVPKFDYPAQNIEKWCKEAKAKGESKERCVDALRRDLGSREFLEEFDELMWYPSEVDVSIRLGWFYHFWQKLTIRSVKNLMNIYYTTVGGNSLLLLNIPPNKRGLFAASDVKRLKKMGEIIRKDEKNVLPLRKITTTNVSKKFNSEKNLFKHKTFSPELAEKYDITIWFDKAKINKVNIQEDTDFSQRVEEFAITTKISEGIKTLYEGTVIGFNKIALFSAVTTDNLTLTITKCRKEPYLKKFEAVKA